MHQKKWYYVFAKQNDNTKNCSITANKSLISYTVNLEWRFQLHAKLGRPPYNTKCFMQQNVTVNDLEHLSMGKKIQAQLSNSSFHMITHFQRVTTSNDIIAGNGSGKLVLEGLFVLVFLDSYLSFPIHC